MTIDEAIRMLIRIKDRINFEVTDSQGKMDALNMAIKALEQQPCEDWYDVPSDEMTLEQAKQAVKDLRKKLAEYLEQKPCDAISRQATVERLCKVGDFMNERREGLGSPYIMAALFIQDNKDEFPSVTPKEKTGVWVPIDEEPHEVYECNACGWLLYDEDRTDFKYCPNCGARMVSE